MPLAPPDPVSPIPLLEARDIVVTRGGRRLLDGASLALFAGRIATLQGASGSGKTTLLRVLATLTEPDGGTLLLDGFDVREASPRPHRAVVAYVPQQPPMLPGSVLANVAAGPRLRGAELAPDEAAALLERVGLDPGFAPRAARDLSGGEQQRVALARALANRPRALLLDEPTSALDPAAAARIVDLVRALARSGLAIAVVTHSAEQAAALGGARLLLSGGRVRAAEGPA